MKKLGKLNINPERLMKNEELIRLRGGYWYDCYITTDYFTYDPVPLDSESCEAALDVMHTFWPEPQYHTGCSGPGCTIWTK